ncbi:MAG: hypothetical protein K1060chlam2_00905 [Chlamydiae bacterium]|nr:hypothetical protein [Chlamydiota bacterium]
MKLTLFLSLLITGSAFAGSVRIMNDTSDTLSAEIYSADGNKKGMITVPAHTNATWQDASGGTYVWSQTPYRVIFICTKSGDQYGIVDGVQQAGTVIASSSSGPHICKVPKKKNGTQESTKPAPDNQNSQQQWQDEEPPGDPIWGPP